MRVFMISLLALSLIPACSGGDLDAALEAAQVKATLDSLWTNYAAASDQRDAILFESLFTPEGVLQFSDTPAVRGREAIGKHLASRYAGVDATGLRILAEDLKVFGSFAVQSGAFEESFTEKGAARTEYGRFMLFAERGEDKVWRIRRLMALEDSTRTRAGTGNQP